MQLQDALARGYFPKELPSIFSSVPFAMVSSSLSAAVPARMWTSPVNLNLARPGALFKTPCDREEEKRTGGVERVMVGGVWTAIVSVEHLPVLEAGDEPLDRRAKRRDLRVVFLVGQGELAAFRLLLRSDQASALVALVAESSAGLLQDIGSLRFLERFRIVRLPGQRVRNPDGTPVEK